MSLWLNNFQLYSKQQQLGPKVTIFLKFGLMGVKQRFVCRNIPCQYLFNIRHDIKKRHILLKETRDILSKHTNRTPPFIFDRLSFLTFFQSRPIKCPVSMSNYLIIFIYFQAAYFPLVHRKNDEMQF